MEILTYSPFCVYIYIFFSLMFNLFNIFSLQMFNLQKKWIVKNVLLLLIYILYSSNVVLSHMFSHFYVLSLCNSKPKYVSIMIFNNPVNPRV